MVTVATFAAGLPNIAPARAAMPMSDVTVAARDAPGSIAYLVAQYHVSQTEALRRLTLQKASAVNADLTGADLHDADTTTTGATHEASTTGAWW